LAVEGGHGEEDSRYRISDIRRLEGAEVKELKEVKEVKEVKERRV
jgi:hypothetical protein